MSDTSYENQLIEKLEAGGEHRVLRKLNVPTRDVDLFDSVERVRTGVVVDVETTGLDPRAEVIIELAIRPFSFDDDGIIVGVGDPLVWKEDPLQPLPPEISALTGLNDFDLMGMSIDERAATHVLLNADLIIAHNASFDRPFVEKRLPLSAIQPWACSCSEIDWRAAGFDGRGLGWLAAQAGWFFDAHRAGNDVDAVIALLGREAPDGRTLLAALLENSAQPTFKIDAVGANYAMKDRLKERGYRWNCRDRFWWIEVAEDDREEEVEWLVEAVYLPMWHPSEWAPNVTAITACERHR